MDTNAPAQTLPGRTRWQRLAPHAVALLVYSGLAVLATLPLVGHLGTHLIATPGEAGHDVWQHTWNMWWVREALLVRHTNPYETPLLFYPAGASLYLHSLNLPLGVLALPLLPLLGLVVTYNLLTLLVLVLAGYGTFLLARHVSGSAPAGLVAGAIVLCSPQRLIELRLAQLAALSDYAIPLALLALLLALERRTWRAAGLVALALLLAGLSKWYNVFYTGLALLPLLLWRLAQAGQVGGWPAQRAELVPWLRVGVLSGGLLLPFVLPGIIEVSTVPYEAPRVLGADVLLLLPRTWAGVMQPVPLDWWEPATFGGLALLLAGLGVGLAWRRAAVWLLMALVCLVLSLGPTLNVGQQATALPLPYALLQALPVISDFRVPYRINAVTTMLLAVVAALGLARLWRGWRPGAAWAAAGALAALVAIETIRLPFPLTDARVSPVYAQLAQQPGAQSDEWSVLELPLDRMDRHFLEMYTQTIHEQAILTGKTSRNLPRLPYEAAPPIAQVQAGVPRRDIIALDTATQEQLVRALRIRYMLVRPGTTDPQRAARQVATARQVLGPLTQVYSDTELRAYRLEPVAAWLDGPGRTQRVPVPLFAGLDRRWSPLEADGTRWLPPDGAGLWLYTPQPRRVALSLTLYSLPGARPLELWLNGEPAATLPILAGQAARRYTLAPLDLPAGTSLLELRAPAGGVSPRALGLGDDTRLLSFNVQRVELRELGP